MRRSTRSRRAAAPAKGSAARLDALLSQIAKGTKPVGAFCNEPVIETCAWLEQPRSYSSGTRTVPALAAMEPVPVPVAFV